MAGGLNLNLLQLFFGNTNELTWLSDDHLGSSSRKLMFIAGFFCSEALVTAVFFKIMHMPGGNQSFVLASVFGMIYVPFYLVRKYRLAY
jgi:hypothetical protein